MKKVLVSMFISVTLVFALGLSVGALTSGDWDYYTSSGKIVLTKYWGSDENVTVPNILEGKVVSEMAVSVFEGNADIKSVTIPNGITAMEQQILAEEEVAELLG